MKNLLTIAAIAGCLALTAAEETTMPDGAMTIENAHLRAVVSPIGARVISLRQAGSDLENVKMLPYVGGVFEVRFGAVLNLNDLRDPYTLALRQGPAGEQILTATAKVNPTDDRPAAATVTKEYLLAPDASQLQATLEIANEGAVELALIPWVRHLMLRGTAAQPEETHLTAHGAYRAGNPIPGQSHLNPKFDWHHFPAANWTSRVRLPLEDGSNTFATVLRPEDMLKLYNWHRPNEDFATQEVIAAPLFIPPGESRRWTCHLVLAPPVRGVVYASPDLLVGCTPFPTGLPAATPELQLDFAATRALAGLAVTARVVTLDEPPQVLAETGFPLNLTPGSVHREALGVTLRPQTPCQLRLTFQRDGQPWYPGDAAGDREEIAIPIVVDAFEASQVVYPDRTARGARLRQLTPQVRSAPQVFAGDAFDAYSLPTGVRCFRQDTFTPASQQPLRLAACAGEYESAHLVLTPKSAAATTLAVAGTPLAGPGGAELPCESVNRFLYVPTTMPSGYNALFPVGEYPEALLPTSTVTLGGGEPNLPLFVTWRVPRDAKPGLYTGAVRFTAGESVHAIPVELTVWNVTLPVRNRWFDTPSSLKGYGTGGIVIHNPDGTPMDKAQLVRAVIDMHLKYGLTPCDSGFVNDLLNLRFEAFDPEMQRHVDAGATKLFLGQIPALLKAHRERLPQIQQHLEEKGWTDYFYVRPGFDEASIDLVPQIRAVCAEWKQLSKVPIMETYYHDQRADELYGHLDIWSRSPSDAPWIRERLAAGDRFWKVNAFPNALEPDPWEYRRRYLSFWDYRFTGTYIWTVKQWDRVTRWGEDYWCDAGVGNLAAVLMWPHESGILSTIRLESLRDSLDDTALFWLLREKVESLAGQTPADPAQAAALAQARQLCSGQLLSEQVNGPADLERFRLAAGNALSVLNTIP